MIRRALLVAVAATGVLVIAGGAALGHAGYVKSSPAADARLARAPAEVRVTFSEPPDPRGSDIAVLDERGVRQSARDVALATDEPNTIRVSVGALPEGGYLVTWTALSIVDGHETKGAFAFAIGNAPLPAIPDIGPAAGPPSPLEVAGRALSFAGIAVVLGVAAFVLFVRVPVDPEERRRERALFVAGGAALVGGAALLLLAYGTGIPGRLLLFVLVRAGAGALTVGASLVPERIASAGLRREAAAFAGLVAAVATMLVSHAAAGGEVRYMVADLVHIVAISVWSGGVLALLVVAVPVVRDARELGATVWRFSVAALACVGLIVATGTMQALDRLVLLEDLFETPFGVALLAKIVMLVLLVGLGGLNLFLWGPRLRAGLLARRRLALTVMTETALFAAILVASAFLTALVPPAQANAAAFDETQRVGGVRLELLLPTTNPGRNRYVVRVSEGLAPVTNAERVALRFTMVEHDMGEQELIATQRAPGEYVAEGSPTAMFGTWKVQTIVRLPGRLDVQALFTVPIANTGGQVAKVVTLAPYTAIVFADPSEPRAGAPFTLNIVLVDAKGDPVTGKQVSASFSGPASRTFAATDEGASSPGRYTVAVDALDAGTWTVAVGVGGEASGTTALEVAR